MRAGEPSMGLCTMDCTYRNADGICGYSAVHDQTRTKTLMDKYGLQQGSKRQRRMLRAQPCPLYKKKAPR